MTVPRLKRWFCPVTPEEYAQFEVSREIPVSPIEIDIATGQVRGRPHLYLSATTPGADDWLRAQLPGLQGAVYVIGVPAACIDRQRCQPQGQGWQYNRTIHIPGHCGVERVDLQP